MKIAYASSSSISLALCEFSKRNENVSKLHSTGASS